MKKAILYKITNTITKEEYIGVTTMLLYQRWGVHLYRMRHGIATEKLQRTFNEYGESNLSISEIETGPLPYMLLREKELTKETVISGLNSIIGGGDTEERRGASLIYKKNLESNPELMDRFKKRMRDINVGKKMSEGAKDKIRQSRLGQKMNESERIRRKTAYSGSGNPNAGNYKLFLNTENGIYYTTPELLELFSTNKSGMQWLRKKGDSRLNRFIKV